MFHLPLIGLMAHLLLQPNATSKEATGLTTAEIQP
jgi:hypothetical protein